MRDLNLTGAQKCNTLHHFKELSFFTSGMSVLLFIATAFVNILFIYVLIKTMKVLRRSMFYKLILNIAIADLLTALISDTTSVSFHTKEGLEIAVTKGEIYLLHSGLFIINGASILTMAILCVDRVIAISYPLKYLDGLKGWKFVLISLSTWISSALLCIPYFQKGYIEYLKLFSSVTVTITFLILCGAAVIYKIKLKPADDLSMPYSTKKFEVLDVKTLKRTSKKSKIDNDNDAITKQQEPIKLMRTKSAKSSSLEKRANRSFVYMLVVFLVTYLPAAAMITYMNLCFDCNCVAIHALRDLTYLSILSSALWRPLNFIIRLSTIRKQIRSIFSSRKLKDCSKSYRSKSTDNTDGSEPNT